MRDVAERAHVNYRGLPLTRLRQIGLNRIPQQRHHRTDATYLTRENRRAVLGPSDHDILQAFAQVRVAGG